MEKKIVTVMLAAAMCVCLAACGEKNNSSIEEGPVAGGAVTKVTSAAEKTESAAEDDNESKAEENVSSETEAPKEEEPELATAYEGSLTEAFAGSLSNLEFGLDFVQYVTDGDEGMKEVESTYGGGNGEIVHMSTVTAEGGVEKELLVYEGKLYSREDGAEKYSYVQDMGESDKTMFAELLMGRPQDMEFVSSDSYSDGTIEEIFSDGEKDHTYLYSADGILISIESDRTLILVSSYEDTTDIEITDAFKDMIEF